MRPLPILRARVARTSRAPCWCLAAPPTSVACLVTDQGADEVRKTGRRRAKWRTTRTGQHQAESGSLRAGKASPPRARGGMGCAGVLAVGGSAQHRAVADEKIGGPFLNRALEKASALQHAS